MDPSTGASLPLLPQGDATEPTAPAVVATGLHKSYGDLRVVRGLDLTIERGSVYALLGPSGCGKTTLLRCILGRLRPTAGHIRVLGRTPGAPGHVVPGPGVGYMPQDLALFDELSITENLRFYARLAHMTDTEFATRQEWLLRFLFRDDNEPPVSPSKLVSQLSGGQRRRVSLAIALLNPASELLCLDEPTVGVDARLRESIWTHITELAQRGVTVLITTHYVEEARRADVVGMQSAGTIVAEGDPSELMARYDKTTLEGVFLHVLREQDSQRKDVEEGVDTHAADVDGGGINEVAHVDEAAQAWLPTLSQHRVQALVWQKATVLRRTPLLLAFTWLVPALEIVLFCVAIGATPKHLNVAVINDDVGNGAINLGDWFVDDLHANHSHILDVHEYRTWDRGMAAVRRGDAYAVIHIPANFTRLLPERLDKMAWFDPAKRYVFDESTVRLAADSANSEIFVTMMTEIEEAFAMMLEELGKSLHVLPWVRSSPLELEAPVYGPRKPKFSSFLVGGIVVIITFGHSVGLTSLGFVKDNLSMVTDRICSAGTSSAEIVFAHSLTFVCVLIIQVLLEVIIAVYVFGVPQHGNIATVVLIALGVGLAGMSLGLVIAAVSREAFQAIQLSLGSFFPMMLLSGVLWPLQAVPSYISWLALCMPTTWAARAMRNVMLRGYALDNSDVWHGILVCLGWASVLQLVATRLLRAKTM